MVFREYFERLPGYVKQVNVYSPYKFPLYSWFCLQTAASKNEAKAKANGYYLADDIFNFTFLCGVLCWYWY